MDNRQAVRLQAGAGRFLVVCVLLTGTTLVARDAVGQTGAGTSNTTAQQPTQQPEQPAQQPEQPTAQAPTQEQQDAQIAGDINNKLMASNPLRPLDLGVWVHDAGIVTITGTVPNRALQQQAETLVRAVSGVRSVEDKVMVGAVKVPRPKLAPATAPAATAVPAPMQQPQPAQMATPNAASNATPNAVPNAVPGSVSGSVSGQGAPAGDALSGGQPGAPTGAPTGAPPGEMRPLITAHAAPAPPTSNPPTSNSPNSNPTTLPQSGIAGDRQRLYDQPKMTLHEGTPLRVQMLQRVDSKHSKPGDDFRGVLAESVRVDGLIALPRGAAVEGTVIDARPAGHLKGKPILALQVSNVNVGEASYVLTTQPWMHEGPGKGGQTASNAVGGTLLGAFAGAITGGGVGALLGGAIGGGAATGISALTPGARIFVPAESVITFRLTAPLVVREPTVNEVRNAEANAPAQPRQRYGQRYGYGNPYPPAAPPGYPPIIQRSGPFLDDPPE